MVICASVDTAIFDPEDQTVDEFRMRQKLRRGVEGDVHIGKAILVAGCLFCWRAADIDHRSKRAHEPILPLPSAENRREAAWPVLGVVPGARAFPARDHLAGLHAQRRLVVVIHTAGADRLAEFSAAAVFVAVLAVERAVIDFDLVAATFFGFIHGKIGPHEKVVVAGVLSFGRQGRANAGLAGQIKVFPGERFGDFLQKGLTQLFEIFQAGHFRAYDNEFVTADTGHQIVLADVVAQGMGRVQQNRITGGMAVCVIDALEFIKVDMQQANAVAMTEFPAEAF